MFEGLKKGYAEGKKDAMIRKYIADEKAKIAARKKQENAKPSKLGKAIGSVAYKVGKQQKAVAAKAEPTGKTASKLVAGAKWIWDNIPDQKKASVKSPAQPRKTAPTLKQKAGKAPSPNYVVMMNQPTAPPKRKKRAAPVESKRDHYLNIR